MSIEESMIRKIVSVAKERLSRELTEEEMGKISQKRGLLGYEAIIDTISNDGNSREEIERYLANLT
jgi:hypothetical protein